MACLKVGGSTSGDYCTAAVNAMKAFDGNLVIPNILWIPWLSYSQSSVFEVSLRTQDLGLECPCFRDLVEQFPPDLGHLPLVHLPWGSRFLIILHYAEWRFTCEASSKGCFIKCELGRPLCPWSKFVSPGTRMIMHKAVRPQAPRLPT